MSTPLKYRFDCDCVYLAEDVPAKYVWDKRLKRTYCRVICPKHFGRLTEKIFICQKCGEEFSGGPKASSTKFCPKCNPRKPSVKRAKSRNVKNDAVCSLWLNKKQPLILPAKKPNVPPCERCDYGNGDKNGLVCQNCQARVEWVRIQSYW